MRTREGVEWNSKSPGTTERPDRAVWKGGYMWAGTVTMARVEDVPHQREVLRLLLLFFLSQISCFALPKRARA